MGFARAFRKTGSFGITKNMTIYKVGDIVDVKGTGNVQKGMPHKVYHGKTGRVFNVSRRAVGVVINKRIIAKRINVRIEHVQHSTSRTGFLTRAAANDAKKVAATAAGERAGDMRRIAKQPELAKFVSTKGNAVQELRPIAFDFLC